MIAIHKEEFMIVFGSDFELLRWARGCGDFLYFSDEILEHVEGSRKTLLEGYKNGLSRAA